LRGEGHFENVATTERRGIEASVAYDVANRLSVFAAYTFQHATFGTDLRIASRFHPDADAAEISVAAGSRMPGVPAHTAKSGVTAALTERLNVGVNVRMQSGQFLRGDEGNLLAPLPGFTLVNAHARHRVTSRVTAVVQAQNIFGAEFYTFGVLGDAASLLGDDFDDPRFYSPGAPRAAWVGIEVRF
jgi:outer membrane receptor protein involved in Fe transport